MILVDLTRDMRPHRAGESVLLPDHLALRLIEEGAARNPRDRFDKPLPQGADAKAVPEAHRRRYTIKSA